MVLVFVVAVCSIQTRDMAQRERLSREQKGKGIATRADSMADLTRNGSPLDKFSLIHQVVMLDSANLDLSQHLLVADAARLVISETEGQSAIVYWEIVDLDESSDSEEGSPPDQRNNSVPIDFYPISFYPGGIFEEFPTLAPELMRSLRVEGQSWGNVLETQSTPGTVKRLMRECGDPGITFLIPT